MALPGRGRRSRNKPVEHRMSHAAKRLYDMSDQMSSKVGKEQGAVTQRTFVSTHLHDLQSYPRR
jgi:hypothetical protein